MIDSCGTVYCRKLAFVAFFRLSIKINYWEIYNTIIIFLCKNKARCNAESRGRTADIKHTLSCKLSIRVQTF